MRGNVEDTSALAAAMDGHDVVIHLASNPDIARAANEPSIDFTQGTALTQSVVEAMRTTSAKRILYASGSGVYGDLGTHEAAEDHGPLVPVSTYGASKLAGEALIASYAAMFGLSGCVFRFGNVVGPRQTHGVGFDFARALLRAIAAGEEAISLRVLGDGSQSKSYIHVDDVLARRADRAREDRRAVRRLQRRDGRLHHRAGDRRAGGGVRRSAPGSVRFAFTGGDRGWKGDVPVVRLDTRRIRTLGWRCRAPVARGAARRDRSDDPRHASGAHVSSRICRARPPPIPTSSCCCPPPTSRIPSCRSSSRRSTRS